MEDILPDFRTFDMGDWILEILRLAISDWRLADPLIKEIWVILNFKGLVTNSKHYNTSCKLPIASGILHKP